MGDEVPQSASQPLDGVESVPPEEVLLEGADEALGDAVALRLADEGGRALDAEEADLRLEVASQIARAVVVAQRQAFGRAAVEGAEVAQHALPDRLERFEAVARMGGMAGLILPL